MQAIALALPGSLVALSSLEGTPHYLYYVLLPWLYPLYYVALFLPRQMDDDAQLCAKYGELAFAEYTRRVPYRVVPGVWWGHYGSSVPACAVPGRPRRVVRRWARQRLTLARFVSSGVW